MGLSAVDPEEERPVEKGSGDVPQRGYGGVVSQRVRSARLTLSRDVAAFLAEAADHLAAQPVINTVVATAARRSADDPAPDDRPYWWLTVRDDAGTIVGAGMRTAPFDPYPPYLLPMPDIAGLELARVLHDRGEPLGGVNGALPVVSVVAEESARLTGGVVTVAARTRLFELGDLVAPPRPAGRLRRARSQEATLAAEWLGRFHAEAAIQAGRDPTEETEQPPDEVTIRRRIGAGMLWWWEAPDQTLVHLTGANPPAFGVARVGPVYTPREFRGRGYAAAAVAEVSRTLRAGGARVCLFTDQANPTSNRIYAAIGYRPVADSANLLVRRS